MPEPVTPTLSLGSTPSPMPPPRFALNSETNTNPSVGFFTNTLVGGGGDNDVESVKSGQRQESANSTTSSFQPSTVLNQSSTSNNTDTNGTTTTDGDKTSAEAPAAPVDELQCAFDRMTEKYESMLHQREELKQQVAQLEMEKDNFASLLYGSFSNTPRETKSSNGGLNTPSTCADLGGVTPREGESLKLPLGGAGMNSTCSGTTAGTINADGSCSSTAGNDGSACSGSNNSTNTSCATSGGAAGDPSTTTDGLTLPEKMAVDQNISNRSTVVLDNVEAEKKVVEKQRQECMSLIQEKDDRIKRLERENKSLANTFAQYIETMTAFSTGTAVVNTTGAVNSSFNMSNMLAPPAGTLAGAPTEALTGVAAQHNFQQVLATTGGSCTGASNQQMNITTQSPTSVLKNLNKKLNKSVQNDFLSDTGKTPSQNSSNSCDAGSCDGDGEDSSSTSGDSVSNNGVVTPAGGEVMISTSVGDVVLDNATSTPKMMDQKTPVAAAKKSSSAAEVVIAATKKKLKELGPSKKKKNSPKSGPERPPGLSESSETPRTIPEAVTPPPPQKAPPSPPQSGGGAAAGTAGNNNNNNTGNNNNSNTGGASGATAGNNNNNQQGAAGATTQPGLILPITKRRIDFHQGFEHNNSGGRSATTKQSAPDASPSMEPDNNGQASDGRAWRDNKAWNETPGAGTWVETPNHWNTSLSSGTGGKMMHDGTSNGGNHTTAANESSFQSTTPGGQTTGKSQSGSKSCMSAFSYGGANKEFGGNNNSKGETSNNNNSATSTHTGSKENNSNKENNTSKGHGKNNKKGGMNKHHQHQQENQNQSHNNSTQQHNSNTNAAGVNGANSSSTTNNNFLHSFGSTIGQPHQPGSNSKLEFSR